MKKTIKLMLAMAAVVGMTMMTSCKKEEKEVLHYQTAVLEKSWVKMMVKGDQISLFKKNEFNSSVQFESSNEKVATVSAEGVATALEIGVATITATLDGDVVGVYKVSVCNNGSVAAYISTKDLPQYAFKFEDKEGNTVEIAIDYHWDGKTCDLSVEDNQYAWGVDIDVDYKGERYSCFQEANEKITAGTVYVEKIPVEDGVYMSNVGVYMFNVKYSITLANGTTLEEDYAGPFIAGVYFY